MFLPRKLTGKDTPWAIEWNRMVDCLKALQPTGTDVISTPLGTVRRRQSASGVGSSSADSNFRGEWLESAFYLRGNRVVISLGANRGIYEYVAFTASSGHEPWLGGGYWFKTSDSLGQWM